MKGKKVHQQSKNKKTISDLSLGRMYAVNGKASVKHVRKCIEKYLFSFFFN
jgi:hypothetical protein